MSISADILVENFAERLSAGQAALFVGAGLSRGSGLVDWKGLLAIPAQELGIGLDVSFADIAEFFAQRRGRGALIEHLRDTLIRPAELTDNHRLIVQLPVNEIWTTNYDTLLEDAFRAAGKVCDVKRRDADFVFNTPGAAARLYKMHGDFVLAEEVVITRTDYDQYDRRYPLMGSRFFDTLAETTLLFLGCSFSDPNFLPIMGKLASRVGDTMRPHYAVMLHPGNADPSKARAFDLFLEMLLKYGIQACVLDQPQEVTWILQSILAKCRMPSDILLSQDKRDEFIVNELERLVTAFPTSPPDLRIAAIFSSFAVPDPADVPAYAAYAAAEPSNSPTHMPLLCRERGALESLVQHGAKVKLLLCALPSLLSQHYVRYKTLLKWLEHNNNRPNLDVRCATIDYFENALIARERFCIIATYNPLYAFYDNRVFRDRQSIEWRIKDFDDRFDSANLAKTKKEVIDYYRESVNALSNKDDAMWRTESTRVLHQWRDLSLIRDKAEVPGLAKPIEYTFVHHPGSVLVVPVDPSGRLLLIEQYRYLTKSYSLEFPAGGIEHRESSLEAAAQERESPLEAAKRELKEETGYVAQHWERLGEFFTTNSLTDERITVFLAKGLVEDNTDAKKDVTEDLALKRHSFEELCGMVRDGVIKDGPTIVCLHYFREFLASR